MAVKRTQEEKKVLCDLWQQSGLTGNKFCKLNHISTRSIWQWAKLFSVPSIKSVDTNTSVTKSLRPQKITNNLDFYPIGQICSNNADNYLEFKLPNGIQRQFGKKLRIAIN